MSDQPVTSPAPNPAEQPTFVHPNPAVDRCSAAYARTHQKFIAAGERLRASLEAKKAYCESLPYLSGADNIRDFVACVAHGMATEVITQSAATKLLYAAQVAYNTLPRSSAKLATPLQ